MSIFKNWKKDKPQPFKRIVIRDENGVSDGHLSTPIMYDGENARTNLAHTIRADVKNIVEWCYLQEL